MKRYVAAAALAVGLWLGSTAPAGAIIIDFHTDVVVGNPDVRVAVDGGFEPCIADGGIGNPDIAGVSRAVGDMAPCIAEGRFAPCIADGGITPCIVEVEVRVDTQRARS